MRRATFVILMLVLFSVPADLCVAAGGHILSNPLAGTTPPSSYGGNRLYRGPNPVDTRSNLVVTGNVRAGRSFRPGVPYYGQTEFQGTLGSTELDSFIRDSAGAESWRRGGSQPYFFSGTKTVPTTQAGYSGVFNPSESRVTGKVGDVYGLDTLRGAQAKAAVARPSVTSSGLDMDMLTSEEATMSALQAGAQDKKTSLSESRFKTWREKVDEQMQSLQIDKGETDESGRPLKDSEATVDVDELAAQVMGDRTGMMVEDRFEQLREDAIRRRAESAFEEGTESAGMTVGKGTEATASSRALKELSVEEILSQIKKDVGAAEEDAETATGDVTSEQSLENAIALATRSRPASKSEDRYFTLYGSDRMQEMAELSGEEMDDLKAERQTYNFTRRRSAIEEINSMSREDLAAEAKEIMGPYTDMAAYNEARFREKYQVAAIHLRQGNYRQAADGFEAASLYVPGHPAAYVGRALALFALGEYAGSSLFLSRALSSKPAYASTEVDLAAALGGREKLDSRVTDLEQWLGQSSDGEFEFLLAYVYYQMGRFDKAQIAIKTAVRRMGNQAAVTPLKEAIERAVNASSRK